TGGVIRSVDQQRHVQVVAFNIQRAGAHPITQQGGGGIDRLAFKGLDDGQVKVRSAAAHIGCQHDGRVHLAVAIEVAIGCRLRQQRDDGARRPARHERLALITSTRQCHRPTFQQALKRGVAQRFKRKLGRDYGRNRLGRNGGYNHGGGGGRLVRGGNRRPTARRGTAGGQR